VLLHSPIRDVYLCIQGFDSRLACRICNNTVQSRIRADGPFSTGTIEGGEEVEKKKIKKRKRRIESNGIREGKQPRE